MATTVVVIGGILAGGASSGRGIDWWGVPAIPVEPSINLAVALSLFYGGLILLVRAWVKLRRWVLIASDLDHSGDGATVDGWYLRGAITVLVITCLWAVPFLVGPPLGSRDVYAYEAQGRMAEVGLDVYAVGPGALGDDPVLEAMDPIYLESPVVYGPIFVELASAVSTLTSTSVRAVYAFRALAVLGLVVAGLGVWDLARRSGRNPVDALVLTLANPLVLLHLVSGAHNEAIMLGFLVGGVAVGQRAGWRWLGVAFCALGAAVKVPAVLGVAFVAWPWVGLATSQWKKGIRIVISCLGALLVLGVAGRLTGWGWGWIDGLQVARPVDAYLSVTRVFGGAIHFVTGAELDPVLGVVRMLGLAIAFGATAYLVMRSSQSAPVALGWSLLLFAVMHPTTQPWYLTWGLLFIAAGSAGSRNRAFMVLSAFASFVVLPVGPQLGLALLEQTGAGVIALTMAILVLLTFSPLPSPAPFRGRSLDTDMISVIVPTRNEAPNIGPLVRRVGDSFPRTGGPGVEVIFVDDSDDSTAEAISILVEKSKGPDWSGPDVRLCHRHSGGRWGGLGGAVVDGFAEARGSIAVVIDGDLQHPPEKIPALVSQVQSGTDLVVASRRVDGGSGGDGLTVRRDWMSRAAGRCSRSIFPQRVGRIADPLSGFFAVRLSQVDHGRLHPDGFKILIELLATHAELSTTELPYRFADREEGASKADVRQGIRFISHLLDLRLRTSRPWAGSVGPQRIYGSG